MNTSVCTLILYLPLEKISMFQTYLKNIFIYFYSLLIGFIIQKKNLNNDDF